MAESAFPPSSLRPLLEEISSLLKERKETVSVAETVFNPSLCLIYGAYKANEHVLNGVLGRRRDHISLPPLRPWCIRLLQRRINSTYTPLNVSNPDH